VRCECESVARAEALDLGTRELDVGVGGREVRHQADHLRWRLGELGEPIPAHAGVELEMHANALGDLVGREAQLEPGLARERDVSSLGWAEHDDLLRRELVAQLEPLRDRDDADRARAGAERRRGDVDRAVPVAVRLDDGPEIGAVELA
jgi:hypothetical protein